MQKLFILFMMAILVVGCGGMTNEEISKQVISSMQSEFSSSNDEYQREIKVIDLTVMKQNGNQYKGLAKVDFDGEQHNMTVNITVDDQSFMWDVPGEEFNFIQKKRIAVESEKFEQEMADIQSNYENEIQQNLEHEMSKLEHES